MLVLRQLQKGYAGPDGTRHVVLDVAQLELSAGAQVALRGASGTGKTTLLHLIAGILVPDQGEVRIDDVDLARLGESQRDRLRAEKIGYIFQTFNLLQGHTVLDNVVLGMAFGPGKVDRDRARQLLQRVGLGERLHHFPRQLSTGQQQRVAVARALANRPRLVLADEPTGNLDPVHARGALSMIREVCSEHGAALLLVSHDEAVLGSFETVLDLAQINRASASATLYRAP